MTSTEYNYETEIDVRYRDLDTMGWAHNSIVLVYVEEAKIRYFQEVFGAELEDMDGAVAHQEIDYRTPVNYGDIVTVHYRIAEIGTSSVTTQFEVETNGDVAAEGEVVYVFLNEDHNPRPIASDWAETIREFESLGE